MRNLRRGESHATGGSHSHAKSSAGVMSFAVFEPSVLENGTISRRTCEASLTRRSRCMWENRPAQGYGGSGPTAMGMGMGGDG